MLVICGFCKSNSTHDKTKVHKNKVLQKLENNLFAPTSTSEFKTKLKSVKVQFINAKVSVNTKTKKPYFNGNNFDGLLKKVFKICLETKDRKNLNHIVSFSAFFENQEKTAESVYKKFLINNLKLEKNF